MADPARFRSAGLQLPGVVNRAGSIGICGGAPVPPAMLERTGGEGSRSSCHDDSVVESRRPREWKGRHCQTWPGHKPRGGTGRPAERHPIPLVAFCQQRRGRALPRRGTGDARSGARWRANETDTAARHGNISSVARQYAPERPKTFGGATVRFVRRLTQRPGVAARSGERSAQVPQSPASTGTAPRQGPQEYRTMPGGTPPAHPGGSL